MIAFQFFSFPNIYILCTPKAYLENKNPSSDTLTEHFININSRFQKEILELEKQLFIANSILSFQI